MRITRLKPGARRASPLAREWLAFDPLIDAEVTADGQTARLERFADRIVPGVARGEHRELAWAVPLVAPVVSELLFAGNVILNVTVPAAVAAAMGLMDPVEAGRVAEAAAHVSAGIPGARARAADAARMACRVMAER